MAGVVIVSHGSYCIGLIDSLKLLVGENAPTGGWIEAIPLESLDSPETLQEKLEKAISRVNDGKGVLILVDLFGGTPSRVASLLMAENPNIEIVSGVNLPMLIQVALERDKTSRELAEIAVKAGAEGIVYVSEKIRESFKKSASRQNT
ncbi:MAG TPA: PTS sugar transporter subunit IIA [Sulfolobales archaeon]|nr:PTS sugar transporter subunit IIA [Sulfolobales archaeon]